MAEEQSQEREIDVTEISLTESEINEWLIKLDDLKENKQPISLEIDDDSELEINFEEEDSE